jgi:hypothetical protein
MKSILFGTLFLLGSAAIAADNEAALKEQMRKECAPLFAEGAMCSNLAKGTRNCVRQNLSKGGAACAAFEKAQTAFFDAGKNDPMVIKK